MFKCKDCDSTDFQLVVRPDYNGPVVEITSNEHNEVVVRANNQEFIADLMFMNQFAVCRNCGAIKSWDYFFHNPEMAM
jgi:hypothetical protein